MADVEKKVVKGKAKPRRAEGEKRVKKPGSSRSKKLRKRLVKQAEKKLRKQERKKWRGKTKPISETEPSEDEKKVKKERMPVKKMLPRYFPTVWTRRPRKHYEYSFKKHPRRLRPSITPGTVLILLAGKYRGKRVIFLKQLGTGLLLVTGPYMLNRVPFRRINQIYVIATKTKLDISGVNVPKDVKDRYFKRKKNNPKKKDKGEIFETKQKKIHMSEKKKKFQASVDKQILRVMQKHPEKKFLFKYMIAPFRLTNKLYPHKIVF